MTKGKSKNERLKNKPDLFKGTLTGFLLRTFSPKFNGARPLGKKTAGIRTINPKSLGSIEKLLKLSSEKQQQTLRQLILKAAGPYPTHFLAKSQEMMVKLACFCPYLCCASFVMRLC